MTRAGAGGRAASASAGTYNPAMPNRATLIAAVLLAALSGLATAGSDVPPEGPPWTEDLLAAHARALAEGKPLFLYFTKTY